MANWKYVKIGDVCTVERGGSPRPIDQFITDDPNGINWIKIGDTDDSMYIIKTAQKIIPEGMKKSRYVQPGDFLLSNSMSFGRPYILKIDGCIHDGWLVLRDNDGIFDKRFLYYYLSAPSTYQKFKNMAVGGVVNNLNSEMVRGVTVPVPTMEEQLNIVVTLDKVTELIAIRKEQLAKLDQLVKSRFIELFGDYRINEKGFDCKKGSELFKFSSGKFLPEEKRLDEGIPVYGGNGIAWYTSESLVDYPTIIIGRVGAQCGNVHAVTTPVWITDNAIYIKEQKTNAYTLEFLTELMRMMDFYQYADFSGQPKITQKPLETLNYIMPPIELQNEYTAFVEQTDKSKLAIQQSLDKLELLKKSLMQEYFG